jgi:hypothetical protein
MLQTANPAPGIRLMGSKESVSFTIFIPIRQQDRETSNLYLYYGGLDSIGNPRHAAFERKHIANGDLQERLILWTRATENREPPMCLWRLDERMPDAFWVREILTELANTRAFELREFLAQCLRDARSHPAKPFEAVFSTAVKSYNF